MAFQAARLFAPFLMAGAYYEIHVFTRDKILDPIFIYLSIQVFAPIGGLGLHSEVILNISN